MNYKLEQKLYEKFSFMDQPCECGDGWFDIIYRLCEEISKAYAESGVPADITVYCIKEKYGMLSFNYCLNNPANKVLHEKITKIIYKYENISETVCEECGKEGSLRNDLEWIQTLCDDCYKNKKI